MNVHETALRALACLVLAVAATAPKAAPPSTLSFVVGNTSLTAADQAIVDKLVSLGHTVLVHDDDGITAGATSGSDAVLISSTVNSSLVGTTFRSDSRPLVLWDAFLYDDMGFTGAVVDVDFGNELDETEIDLVAQDGPLGAGLPLGPTAVTTATRDVSWGRVGGDVTVVATIAGDASRATIFTYQPGDLLTDGSTATGRRAGFFLRDDSATVWTADAELLLEQAVDWALESTVPAAPTIVTRPYAEYVVDGATAVFTVAADGYPAPTYQWQKDGVDLAGETDATLSFAATAADEGDYAVVVTNSEGTVTSMPVPLEIVPARTFSLVVGDLSLNSGDQAIVDKLSALGHSVVLHDDDGITVADTAGSDAVLISATVVSAPVGTTFLNDSRPVAVWESFLFDDMALTGSVENVDFGNVADQTRVDLSDVTHVIADGFAAGPVRVTLTNRLFAWGVPSAGADVVATVAGDTSRATVFAYEQGEPLVGGAPAAGKRVALYERDTGAAVWTGAGEQLFEQMLNWLFAAPLTAPTIITQPADDTVAEGETATFSVVAEGNPEPTYQWQKDGVDLPDETESTLSFVAELDDAGDYRVIVTNSQGSVTSDTATLTVTNVNDPPSFVSTPVTNATEDTPYVYDVEASDPDTGSGDTLSFSGVEIPVWLTLTDNGDGTAVLSGTPADPHVGDHDVVLEVRDSAGLTATQSFTITVSGVNDPPEFTSVPVTSVNEGSQYVYGITVSDPDAGDTLTIEASTLPAWLTLVDHGDGTATLRGTPAQAQVGDHPVVLEATDAAGASDTQSFTLTVVNVEHSPQFTSRPVTAVTEGQVYRYSIVAEDADGDPVTFTATEIPGWITLTNNGDGTGEMLGTPQGEDVGTYAVELFASDGTGAPSASQRFTIVVSPAAEGPVITLNGATQIMIRQGESYVDPGATATDPQDGDLTSLIQIDNTVDTSTIGSYTVTYSVQDSAGNSSQAQRTVVVQRQPRTGGGGAAGWIELLLLALVAARLRRGPPD